jgi:triacylglycerol lipase
MPFIAVLFNYRSSIWGFIANEMLGTGSSNLGLRDQRLALEWIQENIAAFGGDPRKVTLMGGSSRADNGRHLTAFGGRDEGLFRAAILQSGSSVNSFGLKGTSAQQSYDRLILLTAYSDAENPLEYLRHLPFEELNSVFDRDSPSGVTVDMVTQSFPAFDRTSSEVIVAWS